MMAAYDTVDADHLLVLWAIAALVFTLFIAAVNHD